MTAVNGDGIEEDLTRAVGMAMIAASRAAEQISHMSQSAARERQARAAGDTEQAQRELAAHTEAARAYFNVVTRPEYLTAATDEQIREVTRQAQAWRERIPEAQRAEDAATAELGARGPAMDRGPQRAAVLAREAEAADQRAAVHEKQAAGTRQAPPEGWDQVRKYYGPDRTQQDNQQQEGPEAATTAANAQTRPAREAPTATRKAYEHRARRGAVAPALQQPEAGR